MTKHRRIEVNAFRRRVTIVSGEWPRDSIEAQLAQTDYGISLNDTELSEPIAADSPEGQLILVEAMSSLQQRLSPEARATIGVSQNNLTPNGSTRNGFYLKLQWFYRSICARVLSFSRREK
jgi:transcriptional/translational regulatory protein YebC/TACO1